MRTKGKKKRKYILYLKIILLCDSVSDVPVADCGDVGLTWGDSWHNLISDIIIVNIFHLKNVFREKKMESYSLR